jgi:WD40 repeat protein
MTSTATSTASSHRLPIAALARSDDGRLLAVACGAHVVLSDARRRLASTRTPTGALVRSLAVAPTGRAGEIRLLAVADDKRVYALRFDAGVLSVVGVRAFKKRLIACAFLSFECLAVADRFGDAFLCDWATLLAAGSTTSDAVPEHDEFAADFGTLSSITALLTLPPGTRRLAAANRDAQVFLVRVPEVYDIAAFCLGHEAFVTSLAYTSPAAAPHFTVLLSAGGDASIRAWNAVSGAPLADLQLRPDHTPLATLTGVEPVLPPHLVVRALAAFDNDVYYVTQPGAVYHVALAAGDGDTAGALRFLGPPHLLVPANASCVVAVAQGVWVATNDGTLALHAVGAAAPLCSVDDVAMPADSSAAVAAILKEIDPMLFQHQFDSHTRERGGDNDDNDNDNDDDDNND